MTGLVGLALTGCGGSDNPEPSPGASEPAFDRQLEDARSVTAAGFPPAKGKTLRELAAEAETGPETPQAVVATSVFEPGENRLAFGVLDTEQRPVYGKTAVYIAPALDEPATGPYPAPADSLITEPRYRSRQAATEDTPLAAIYSAQARFPKPGRYAVLVMTKRGGKVMASALGVKVRPDSPIPEVGEKPPAVETDTLESVGNRNLLDTRDPPAPELHEASLKDVLGKKPVAVVFATPQLCVSRVCGPVVDIGLQMRAKYGDQMTFIHQEVYEDNQMDKGLRAPLRAFKLQTEPWLFTFDRDGRVAARLEGSFGVDAFEGAVKAALE